MVYWRVRAFVYASYDPFLKLAHGGRVHSRGGSTLGSVPPPLRSTRVRVRVRTRRTSESDGRHPSYGVSG